MEFQTMHKKTRLALLVVALIGEASFVALFCGGGARGGRSAAGEATGAQLEAVLDYVTTRVVPQHSLGEIAMTFDVLKSVSPCNFLVFGLGHDSLTWAAFNPGGTTLFLEESSDSVRSRLKDAPGLHADVVPYRTKLSEADELLEHYRTEPSCRPNNSFLRGNTKCRLALNMLTDKVYDTEWDVIMIDAPRGYFPEASGRMAAIYSVAIMARNREKSGVTHVFLHDVDRKVESTYAETFLCRKHLVKAVGRLWHFKIPPATNTTDTEYFC